MVHVPRIGSPDLILVAWVRKSGVCRQDGGKDGEGSRGVGGTCFDLIPGGGRLVGV